MKVVVTGGAGFIGHHLVGRLVAEGHETIVLDNLRRSTFERPELTGARCTRGDIRDRAACSAAFDGADVVVHLAAQSNVMGSQADPDYAFCTNVVGTWEVAQAAIAAGVRRLVFASSREVYGDARSLPVHESAPLRPRNIYGASKVAAESMLSAIAGTALEVAVLRLSNVIGPGDAGRVVPLWLQRARAGCPLEVFGGNQVLDLVPVDFVASVLLRVATEPTVTNGPMNVGSGISTPILELARQVVRPTGSKSSVRLLPPREAEVSQFRADVERLKDCLGMNPPSNPLASIEATW